MKTSLAIASVLLVLVSPGVGVGQEQGRGRPALDTKGGKAREEVQQATETWACNATIALAESSHGYSPPRWLMSGLPSVDKDKKCKEHIQQTWLDNGAVWKLLKMSVRDQNTWCQKKERGTFRVDYGFEKVQAGDAVGRPGHTGKKDASFTQALTVNCVFDVSMSRRP